jgi:hypothetical protein
MQDTSPQGAGSTNHQEKTGRGNVPWSPPADRFVRAPWGLIRSPWLTAADLRVALVVLDLNVLFDGNLYVTNSYLARLCGGGKGPDGRWSGMSPNAVRDALKNLEHFGFLNCVRDADPKNKSHRRIVLRWKPGDTIEPAGSATSLQPAAGHEGEVADGVR